MIMVNDVLLAVQTLPSGIFAFQLTVFTSAAFVGAALLLILRLWHSGASQPRDGSNPVESVEVPSLDRSLSGGIKLLRPVKEDEVICEFLRNELHHPDFDRDREEVTNLLLHPNLQNATETQQRRDVFFRKRGAMWRELPRDTQWWEIELRPDNLEQIRIFPRADWRHFSQDGFGLKKIASRIRQAITETPDDPFLADIESLSRKLPNQSGKSAVVLIGLNDRDPLTVLEGNHRMVAALLASTPVLDRFRFFCGLSPHMNRCCWYRTSLIGLAHYAGNLMRNFGQIRHSDVARVLPRRKPVAGAPAVRMPDATVSLTAATPDKPR